MIGAWEIVAIVFVVLLFVGGKKIPELMKGVGKGVKSFKEGLNGIEDEVKKSGADEQKPLDTKPSDKTGESSES